MPDVTAATFVSKDPKAYNYTLVGTVAGTTTIQSEPCFFKGIVVPTRVASGVITIYDSIGTSANVIGTITLGSQTFSDPPPLYEFDIAAKNALTVVNSANQGAVVLFR
jgi:hypothetical protein